MVLVSGFEEAIVGYGVQFNRTVVVYDYAACLRILMDNDMMSLESAIEYMDAEVIGSLSTDESPVFLHRCESEFVVKKWQDEDR
jgi:hypothetical protein